MLIFDILKESNLCNTGLIFNSRTWFRVYGELTQYFTIKTGLKQSLLISHSISSLTGCSRPSQTVPTCCPTFEPILFANMLANMLARFAIGTNMLGKKKKVEKCWPTCIKFLINVGQHC